VGAQAAQETPDVRPDALAAAGDIRNVPGVFRTRQSGDDKRLGRFQGVRVSTHVGEAAGEAAGDLLPRRQGLLCGPEGAAIVVEGQLDVISATRRNRNLRVTATNCGSYLIKQPTEPGAPAAETVRQEARFYTWCGRAPQAGPVRGLLPRLVHADPDRALLVLELLPDAVPLWRHYERSRPEAFPAEAAALVGEALARLHAAFRGVDPSDDPSLGWLSSDPPWSFSLHRPRIEAPRDISAANREMVRIMQARPAVFRALDALRPLWQRQTLIHGDVKMDNCLLLTDSTGAERLVLADWELVQLGDPAWDLAGALNDFLFFWVVSMPHDRPLEKMTAEARYPLPVIQPAIRALWRAYARSRTLPEGEAEALLGRAVRFAAVRTLQTAYEIASHFAVMPIPSVLLMQVAINLLADPERGRAELFGLEAVR